MKLRMVAAILTIFCTTTVGFALTSCSSDDPVFSDCGFSNIADVFKEVKTDETVVFVLRHAERGEDYSPAGLLTENGKKQSRTVYASKRQIDFHYWINHKWINYLTGIAVIIDPQGNMRFKTVCDFGYLYNQGTAVTCDDAAVLPAIIVDLEKADYQKTTSVESTDVNNN